MKKHQEQQKVAVVTGGANGIGKCITEEFRKLGVKVYVIDKMAGDHYQHDKSPRDLIEMAMKPISSPPFPLERIEEMTRLMGGDGELKW